MDTSFKLVKTAAHSGKFWTNPEREETKITMKGPRDILFVNEISLGLVSYK